MKTCIKTAVRQKSAADRASTEIWLHVMLQTIIWWSGGRLSFQTPRGSDWLAGHETLAPATETACLWDVVPRGYRELDAETPVYLKAIVILFWKSVLVLLIIGKEFNYFTIIKQYVCNIAKHLWLRCSKNAWFCENWCMLVCTPNRYSKVCNFIEKVISTMEYYIYTSISSILWYRWFRA